MLKPDAVQRGLVGQIMQRFEKKGFKLVAMKLCSPGKAHMEAHYADLSKKKFFPSLVEYMISGPVCAMIWEGEDAVKTGRVMLGATRPQDSLCGTIRGDMCIDVGRNIIHGSDAVESANHEIALWFKESELCQWAHHSAEWVYEMPEKDSAPVAKEEKKDASAAADQALSADEAAKIQRESDENEACIAARIKAEGKIRKNEDEVKARQAAAAKLLEATMSQKTGTLKIKIEKADCSVMVKKGPFFRIEGIKEDFKFETEVLAKTKKPVWNAEFVIPIADFQHPVKFSVLAKDEAGEDYIGEGSFRPMVFTTGAPPYFPFMNNTTKKPSGKAYFTAVWEVKA
jgi:nucleoside-diphosphate kinase